MWLGVPCRGKGNSARIGAGLGQRDAFLVATRRDTIFLLENVRGKGQAGPAGANLNAQLALPRPVGPPASGPARVLHTQPET